MFLLGSKGSIGLDPMLNEVNAKSPTDFNMLLDQVHSPLHLPDIECKKIEYILKSGVGNNTRIS